MTKKLDTPTKAEFVDPICGMTVKPETAAGSFQHEGTTYYFCSKGCREKFIATTEQPKNFVQLGRKKETVQHAEMISAPDGIGKAKRIFQIEKMLPTRFIGNLNPCSQRVFGIWRFLPKVLHDVQSDYVHLVSTTYTKTLGKSGNEVVRAALEKL